MFSSNHYSINERSTFFVFVKGFDDWCETSMRDIPLRIKGVTIIIRPVRLLLCNRSWRKYVITWTHEPDVTIFKAKCSVMKLMKHSALPQRCSISEKKTLFSVFCLKVSLDKLTFRVRRIGESFHWILSVKKFRKFVEETCFILLFDGQQNW